MKAVEFCYWLQGAFELADATCLDEEQTDTLKKHLALVFKHDIDPSQGTPEHQAELSAIHDGELPKKPKPVVIGRPDPFGPKLRC